jgi:adenylate cyclase
VAPHAENSTFLFADLAGFTALTEAHGDEDAIGIAMDFATACARSLPSTGLKR